MSRPTIVIDEFERYLSAIDRCGCCATMTPCPIHGGPGAAWAKVMESRGPATRAELLVPRGRAMSSCCSRMGLVPSQLTVSGTMRLKMMPALPKHPLIAAHQVLRDFIKRGSR